MTAMAIGAELSLVRFLVTVGAIASKAQKRFGVVLHLDERQVLCVLVRGRMALRALQLEVLAFQGKSRPLVVELFAGRFPDDERLVFAIVLVVA